MLLNLKGALLDLTTPVVMGIVNVTPDSFYSESRNVTSGKILCAVEKILNDGGKIIDLGAYSSRPSADHVETDEELRRLSYALDIIRKNFPDIIISVDTFRADVARFVVENYGVAMINDISGGTLDERMFETVADLQVAYVLMHMRGVPATMQQHTEYSNVTAEVLHFLETCLNALRRLGVNDVVIDLGFGFAKTLEQNYMLLKDLACFSELNAPLLVGVSRKSMIYNLLGTDPQHALNGTTAVNMLALTGGASILRVHDVKEAVETVRIFEQYRS